MTVASNTLRLDKGWRFHLGEVKRFGELNHDATYGACKAGGSLGDLRVFLEENEWEDIAVPHDWLTQLPVDPEQAPANGYKKRGKAWYYLAITLPEERIESARLVFAGVLGQTVVYVNGIIAVRNFSGYNQFSCEIGDYLIPGKENILALEVDATTWEGWWYEGAGLYRSAWIEFRHDIRFEKNKCHFRGLKEDGKWNISAELTILGVEDDDVYVAAQLLDCTGSVVADVPRLSLENDIYFPVPEPKLWSPQSPYLYTLVCKLYRAEKCVDSISTVIGLRDIRWSAQGGMYLNDVPYRIKGICCHQDHAGVGAAVPYELTEYRIRRLKEFGINAYRCAHHAPSEDLLEICDRLGMLVMVENRHFNVSEDVMKQLDALVYQARNHPSVFIYSLFNEEPLQKEERGMCMARKMRARILELDPDRAVTAAMNGGVLTWTNASDVLDVIGINYFLADYEACHTRTPGKAILGTENCPTFGTRGVYQSDCKTQVYADDCSEWAAFSESIEQTMECMEDKLYAAGCFAWSGFDYRGEPQPYSWPSVMSHWGIMDICGFAKNSAYYLAAWYRDDLFAHLLPHWNWSEGEMIRVSVFTNGETAELYVNGVSAGIRAVCGKRAEWSIPFTPGSLRVCVNRAGQEAFDEVRTATEPAMLLLTDVTPAHDDSQIRIINVCVTDKQGTILPDYDKAVDFRVINGRILGVGNGDPNSHHMDISDSVNLFHGQAQLILTGDGAVSARCEGLTADC